MHVKHLARALSLLLLAGTFSVGSIGCDADETRLKKEARDDDDGEKRKRKRKRERDEEEEEEPRAEAEAPALPPAQPAAAQPAAVQPAAAPPAAAPPAAAPAAAPPARDPLAGGFFATVPQTRVQIPVPPGWRKSQAGHYMIIEAPRSEAAFLFTTVSSRGEFAGRKQQLLKLAQVSDMHQVGEHDGFIGPSQLRTTIQEFEGTFHGVPGDIQLFFLDQGTGSRTIVLGFVVSQKEVTDPFVVQQFQAIFANVRRR